MKSPYLAGALLFCLGCIAFAQGTASAIAPTQMDQNFLDAAAKVQKGFQISQDAFSAMMKLSIDYRQNQKALPSSHTFDSNQLKKFGIEPEFLDGLTKSLAVVPSGAPLTSKIVYFSGKTGAADHPDVIKLLKATGWADPIVPVFAGMATL